MTKTHMQPVPTHQKSARSITTPVTPGAVTQKGFQSRHRFGIRMGVILCLGFAHSMQGLTPAKITVSAGGLDRLQTVVSFAKPQGWIEPVVLKTPDGKDLPVQYDESGGASFIIPQLKRTESLSLRAARPQAASRHTTVEALVETGGVRLQENGQLVFRYQTEAGPLPRPDIKPIFKRGGYLHPIRTPDGQIITDDFPTNHVHHHGIWSAWTHTEFEGRKPDFWNMGDGKGKVDFSSLVSRWSGDVHAGFVSKHIYTDMTPDKPLEVLDETWHVQLYAILDKKHPAWIADISSTQLLRGQSTLKLPEYRYGGLGFRGNAHWNGKENFLVLTSNGETDREKAHATRANWCYMGGKFKDKQSGLAILCHPSNFRAPQPMRVHPTEPFFNYAPQQGGDMEITPGKPYISKYRLVVFDGLPNKQELDRLWNDYATPPTVTLE